MSGPTMDAAAWDARYAGAELVWSARRSELAVVDAGRDVPLRALRELLALQSSDWAFQITQGYAPPYGRERAKAHAEGVAAALANPEEATAELRSLAPWATTAALLEP